MKIDKPGHTCPVPVAPAVLHTSYVAYMDLCGYACVFLFLFLVAVLFFLGHICVI